jgi:hypothetical protein
MPNDDDLRSEIETPVEPQAPAPGYDRGDDVTPPARPAPEEDRYQNLQSALAEERYRRAQQSQELAALRQQIEQFGTLRSELEAYRKQVRQEEEDPVTELKREIRGLSERYTQDQQAALQDRQALTERLTLENQVRSQVAEFMKRRPDYQNAYNYVVNRRQSDYQAMGIPSHLWGQRLESEVAVLLNESQRIGGNAAETLYNLAKNWGYAPPQQATGAQEPIIAERSFDEGPTSLSDIGGRAETPFSIKDISRLSDEEFDAYWKKYEKAMKGGR